MSAEFWNAACYKFVALDEKGLKKKKQDVLRACINNGLKGTITLSKEGININLCGVKENIKAGFSDLNKLSDFSNLTPKITVSSWIPFRKMRVKIRSELIPGNSHIKEKSIGEGKYISPKELHECFVRKEKVFLLDTRNTYETAVGKFKDAIIPNIRTFQDFPKWLANNLSDKKEHKIITYCTGGIRCEKAVLQMEEMGFQKVYQLSGGILNYFNEVTSKNYQSQKEFYDGECFVFDSRIALDRKLKVSKLDVCYRCWEILSSEEIKNSTYKGQNHCFKCYDIMMNKEKKIQEKQLKSHQEKWDRSKKMRALHRL